MNCREFRNRHLEYSDLSLSAAEHAEVQGHVEHCADCARFDAGVRRSLLLVHNLPAVPSDPASSPWIAARTARAEARARDARSPRSSAGRMMLAAASVALLAGLYSSSIVPPRHRAPELALAPLVAMAAPVARPTVHTMVVRLELTPESSSISPLWPATNLLTGTPGRLVGSAAPRFPPR